MNAPAICIFKNIIKETDSPRLKTALQKNITNAQNIVNVDILKPYLDGDIFEFTRIDKKNYTDINIIIKTPQNNKNSLVWGASKSTQQEFVPHYNDFTEAIMAHLCEKYGISNCRDGFLRAFARFMKVID